MFRTVRVDRNKAEATEPLGSKRKFWFIESGQRYLFKAEERGTGEDWAEKIACELCQRLGLPHVEYDLAEEYDGNNYLQPGVVCPHCAPPPLSLIMGNELLLAQDPRYPRTDHRKYKVTEYTVDAVARCVQGLHPPDSRWLTNMPPGIETALDIFVGYIMLDALIANQDRHHENWAAIRELGKSELRLAPTFDHGASLARNLSDEEREDRRQSRDEGRQIAHFAGRARSAFYASPNDKRTLGTLDAFVRFGAAAPKAAAIWLKTIKGVTESEIEAIMRQVPPNRMSPVTRQFTQELIIVNQQRLVELS